MKASWLRRALARAARVSDEWQARYLEILLIPQVYRRWRQVNCPYFGEELSIARHPGRPYIGYTREQNLAVEDWSKLTGYVLRYTDGYGWNSVRGDYYSHSPATCWDGVRRETFHSFVESLLDCYVAVQEGREPSGWALDNLAQYKIRFVNDLDGC